MHNEFTVLQVVMLCVVSCLGGAMILHSDRPDLLEDEQERWFIGGLMAFAFVVVAILAHT